MKTSRINHLIKISIVSIALVATEFSPRWWVVDAGSDDLLYAKQAVSLLRGDWLGPFQDGAALKLPGFQLFLAISAAIHIPYFILLILLLSFFAFKFSTQFLRYGISERSANLIFGFLVLSPVFYGFSNSRLLRDGFYSVLMLGLITYSAEIYCLMKEPKLNKKKIYFSMLIFTLIGSWLIYTREEGPLALFIIILAIVVLFIFNQGKRFKYQRKLLISLVIFNLISIIGIDLTILNLNRHFYGINSPAILQSGSLDNLIKQWSRVNPVSNNSRISISHEQRAIIYEKIPEIRAIGPKLETNANFYQEVSCNAAQVCDEVGAGWINWAIFYTSQSELPIDNKGTETMKRFDRWNTLIENYCLESEENCSDDLRLPGIGRLNNIPKIIQEIPNQLAYFFQMKATFDPVGLSDGSQANANIFRNILPFSGPPTSWSQTPIGNSFVPLFLLFICLLLIILILISVSADKVEKRFRELWVIYTGLICFSMIVRALTTAIFQVNAVDTKSTQYLMPGVALMWELILLSIILISTFVRRFKVENSKK